MNVFLVKKNMLKMMWNFDCWLFNHAKQHWCAITRPQCQSTWLEVMTPMCHIQNTNNYVSHLKSKTIKKGEPKVIFFKFFASRWVYVQHFFCHIVHQISFKSISLARSLLTTFSILFLLKLRMSAKYLASKCLKCIKPRRKLRFCPTDWKLDFASHFD